MAVNLPYYDLEECKRRYHDYKQFKQYEINDYMLCAGGEEDKDTCSGDSGGPLVRRFYTQQWILSGIVSFGNTPCGQRGIPGVYTKVSKIADWVYEQTAGEVFSDIRFCGSVLDYNDESHNKSRVDWDSNSGWNGSNCHQELIDTQKDDEKIERGGVYPFIEKIYTPYNSAGRGYYYEVRDFFSKSQIVQ